MAGGHMKLMSGKENLDLSLFYMGIVCSQSHSVGTLNI